MSSKTVFFYLALAATLLAAYFPWDNYQLQKKNAFLEGWTEHQQITIDSLHLELRMANGK